MDSSTPSICDSVGNKSTLDTFIGHKSDHAVAPGPIWTPLNPCGGASPEKLEHFGEKTPMGRPGQPNEVAPVFLFLACEDASYMSGQVLHPNGGTVVNG